LSELTVVELVDASSLLDISFFEISAVRLENPPSPDSSDQDEDIEPLHYLQSGRGDDDQSFRIRVRTEIRLRVGTIIADAGVEYGTGERRASEITDVVLLEFANKVAVMALLPYIRQAIGDVSQRVFGAPLLMPMVKRGDLWFEFDESKRGEIFEA
jgi:hypothetical protein